MKPTPILKEIHTLMVVLKPTIVMKKSSNNKDKEVVVAVNRLDASNNET